MSMAQADLTYDAARDSVITSSSGRTRYAYSSRVPPAGCVVVRADSGIKTVTDLKGKRVMFTMPSNMTFTACGDILLKAAGMSTKDIKTSPSLTKVAQEALPENKIDAFIVLFPSVGRQPGRGAQYCCSNTAHRRRSKTYAAVISKIPYAQETSCMLSTMERWSTTKTAHRGHST